MEPKTHGEINIVINALKEHMNEKFGDMKDSIDGLTVQVKTTNGRVKTLEVWRSFLFGAWAVITAMVVPLVIYIYVQQNSVSQTISDSLAETLKKYEISFVP